MEKEEPEAGLIPIPDCKVVSTCRFSPVGCPNFPSICTWDSPWKVCPQFPSNTICGVSEPICRNHVTLLDCGITECPTGTQVCAAPSQGPGPGPERIVVDPDPENPDTVLLRPEDLGRFRRHLEAELERIEQLEQRRGEIEGQLEELASAEKALKKRSKRK
ncbi:MAG TPA: hypothetical protein VFX35_00165 [Solirubrobacterales bacterium]|nr:hypothetical protein [Solirubrobacterales bacterium]